MTTVTNPTFRERLSRPQFTSAERILFSIGSISAILVLLLRLGGG